MQIGHEGYPIERRIELHTDLFAPVRRRSRNRDDCSWQERCHRVIRRGPNIKVMCASKCGVKIRIPEWDTNIKHKPGLFHTSSFLLLTAACQLRFCATLRGSRNIAPSRRLFADRCRW